MVGHQNYEVSPMLDEFCSLLQKEASVGGDFGAAMELGGLGSLAAPYLITRGRLGRALQSGKGLRRAELGGLGLLAVPSAIEIYRSIRGKLSPRRRKP